MTFRSPSVGVAIGLALAALLALDYLKRRALNPGAGLLDRVNPTSPDNFAHVAATELVQGITGDKNAAPGPTFYDWTHPGEDAAAGKSAPSILWMISPIGAAYYWGRRGVDALTAPSAASVQAEADRLADVSPFMVGS